MAKLTIKAGSTSQSVTLFVQDSSVTTGAGLAGIAPAGGSLLSGTKFYYTFPGTHAASVVQSLSVLAAVNSAFSAGGIVQIDNTNMVGVIRLDLPDAMLASGNGNSVVGLLFGGTNMAPVPLEIELVSYDPFDAVRLGLTALPNAAAAAAGGLWILGANAAANTTLTGTAASGATPATPALTLTGGVASTTGGGTASPAIKATGGAGAGSTNGAAAGVTFAGGGTNTVASAADGLTVTGTSTGAGLNAQSGAGATGSGLLAQSNATAGAGIQATGSGTGNGIGLTGGASGNPNTPVTTSYTIKKNTAFNNFEFQMVLASDHVSPATGLSPTVQRSIDGGAYADCTNTPATGVSAGTYKINLSAADLNGNMVTLKMSAATADTTYIAIVTQT